MSHQSHEKTWKKLICILSERSQPEKATYCMASTTWQFGKDKTKEALRNPWVRNKGRWSGTPLTNGNPLLRNLPCNAAKTAEVTKAFSHNSLPITHSLPLVTKSHIRVTHINDPIHVSLAMQGNALLTLTLAMQETWVLGEIRSRMPQSNQACFATDSEPVCSGAPVPHN